MLARMRKMHLGDDAEPTSGINETRRRYNRKALRTIPARPAYSWMPNPNAASPLRDNDDDNKEALVAAEEAADEMREQSTLDDYEADERVEQMEETLEQREERLRSYETTVVDEYEGPLRQSWPHRQDTPRPESPELDEELWGLDRPAVVDEAETERAQRAGGREWYANWAHMHVDHYRNGTMTWEELLEELRRDGPQ